MGQRDGLTQSKLMKNSRPAPLKWTIKAINAPRKSISFTIKLFVGAILLAWAVVAWTAWTGSEDSHMFVSIMATGLTLFLLWILKHCLQKSVFHYVVHATHLQYTHYLDYPENAEARLKRSIISLFVGAAVIAVVLKSLSVFVIGTAYLLLNGAPQLMCWKRPEPELVVSPPWKKFQRMIIDRKYRLVVLLIDDPTIGFKAHLPDDAHLQRYVAFLKAVLPPHVQYSEERWEW